MSDEQKQVTIDRIDMGIGWVCFQPGEQPPPPDQLPGFLNQDFYNWLQRNPEFKVRAVLPIVENGNTGPHPCLVRLKVYRVVFERRQLRRTLYSTSAVDFFQSLVEATTMRYSLFGLLVVGALLTAIASADDAKDEAIKKDRKRIEGKWQITALEINGNKSKDEDVKKLTVVNGTDGTWSVRSEGQEISKGASSFDPTQKPKTIDFTPTKGDAKGDLFLGIYQLGKNTRKLCFAPSGKDRPTEFSSTAENQHILVTFERVKPE